MPLTAQISSNQGYKPTILVVDDILPQFNRDSGSQRLTHLLGIFIELGYRVLFVPMNGKSPEPYYSMLKNMGVEVICEKRHKQQKAAILQLLPSIQIAWLCRPKVNRHFQYIFKYNSKIKWIYDTIDLHFVRHSREADICRNPIRRIQLRRRSRRYKKMEISFAKQADVTIAITETEARILEEVGAKAIKIVPNIHRKHPVSLMPFKDREGIIFIGSYDHSPNRDAVLWLVKQIMPEVWKQLPNINVYLIGNNPTEEIKALEQPNIHVTGFIDNVSPYFLQSRLFVAPLRYGAGMKGKIGQALEYNIPIVSTSIGAEGMNLRDKHNSLIADDDLTFARKILELYTNESLWNHIKTNSMISLEPFTYEMQKSNVSSILIFTLEKH